MRARPILVVHCGLMLLGLVRRAEGADPAPGWVGQAGDGGLGELICGDKVRTARIIELDAPEAMAPQSEAERLAAGWAMQALGQMIRAAGEVSVTEPGQDRCGRGMIRLLLDGEDAARAMIGVRPSLCYEAGARRGWG